MKTLLLALTFCLAAPAMADQFKTVSEKQDSPAYSYVVDYPELFSNSVPAYAKINAGIKKLVNDDGCDASDISSDEPSYDYSATVKIVALNSNYVGVQLRGDSYCGGAHPNDWTSFMTFDSKTGDEVDVAKDFGFQDYDDPNFDPAKDDALRLRLAQIMVNHLPKDAEVGCFGKTRDEQVQSVLEFFPSVGGLAKNKQVVLSIDPPHVAAACYFNVRVDYNVVRDMIAPDSILNTWLK